jgi:hypothetical protein
LVSHLPRTRFVPVSVVTAGHSCRYPPIVWLGLPLGPVPGDSPDARSSPMFIQHPRIKFSPICKASHHYDQHERRAIANAEGLETRSFVANGWKPVPNRGVYSHTVQLTGHPVPSPFLSPVPYSHLSPPHQQSPMPSWPSSPGLVQRFHLLFLDFLLSSVHSD